MAGSHSWRNVAHELSMSCSSEELLPCFLTGEVATLHPVCVFITSLQTSPSSDLAHSMVDSCPHSPLIEHNPNHVYTGVDPIVFNWSLCRGGVFGIAAIDFVLLNTN